MSQQKSTAKSFFKILLFVIGLAFLAVVVFRKKIFGGETKFYNLYEVELSGDVIVRILKTLVVVIACVSIMRASDFVLKFSNKIKDNTAKTAMLLICNVLKYACAIAIVLIVLGVWGVDTTAIVTGASVITLIIGLGCQTLVSDVVSGIFMLFEGDIKVGDIVVINGWRGTVQQIGLRRTRIEDAVGNINIVNNSSISNIINNTQLLSVAVCEVGIEYNESIERVEQIFHDNLDQIKANIPAIVEGPFYKGVSALSNSSVNVKLVAKCTEEDKYQVERDMNREIKLLFDKNNVNIPFDQIVINYRDENESLTKVSDSTEKVAKQFVSKQKELSRGIEEQNN